MKKLTTEEFIKKSNFIHNNYYDYSLTNYVNNRNSVVILCPIHGEFTQNADKHLCGRGCFECGELRRVKQKLLTTEEFIIKSQNIHGYKYNYSRVNYIGNKYKVKLICNEHGEFEQFAGGHLKGKGCAKCAGVNKKNNYDFINESIILHGDFYDYTLTNYKNDSEKIIIKCNRCLNLFEQRPNKHLQGQGCHLCNSIGKVSEPKLLLKITTTFNNEIILSQGSPDWLGLQRFDIYLPKYNIAIEYQGKQHFKPIKWFGGDKGFNLVKINDERKMDLAMKNNCKLFYFSYHSSYVPDIYEYKVFYKEEELIEEIKKEIKCNH